MVLLSNFSSEYRENIIIIHDCKENKKKLITKKEERKNSEKKLCSLTFHSFFLVVYTKLFFCVYHKKKLFSPRTQTHLLSVSNLLMIYS